MAVTITQAPKALEMSGCNPIKVCLETDQFIINPIKMRFTLQENSPIPTAPGDYFFIQWSDKYIRFDFTATPDDSGYQLLDFATAGLSLLDYRTYLINSFLKIIDIFEYFNVSFGVYLTLPAIHIEYKVGGVFDNYGFGGGFFK